MHLLAASVALSGCCEALGPVLREQPRPQLPAPAAPGHHGAPLLWGDAAAGAAGKARRWRGERRGAHLEPELLWLQGREMSGDFDRLPCPGGKELLSLPLPLILSKIYFIISSPLIPCLEAEIPADETQEIRLHLQDSPLWAAHGTGDGRRERAAHPAGRAPAGLRAVARLGADHPGLGLPLKPPQRAAQAPQKGTARRRAGSGRGRPGRGG